MLLFMAGGTSSGHNKEFSGGNVVVKKNNSLFRWIMNRFKSPYRILGVVMLVVVAFFVIMPMITLLKETVTVSLVDSFRIPGMKKGGLTFYHWNKVLSRHTVFLQPLLNSMTVSVGTALFSMVIGCSLAWLVTRTNVKFKGLISVLAIVPYVLPSWSLALPWLEFFKNTSVGRPRGILEYYTGIQAPEWFVFGPIPIIIVMGLHYYPFIFLMVSSALTNIDSQVEEASELLGASRWCTLKNVTFPAVVPALLAALLLSFARTVGTYGTPALLGSPAGYTVLSVQIRSFLKMNLMAQASILALMLTMLSMFLLYINEKYVGKRKSYSLIGGKGFKSRLVDLGNFKNLFSYGTMIFLILCVVVPLGLLVLSSFMKSTGTYSLDNLTLHYWIGKPDPNIAQSEPGLLRNPAVWLSTLNSLKLAISGGLICAVIGMLIGYAVVKGRGEKISSALERISFIPMLVPSIAFGAVYLTLFSKSNGPLPALYGTFTLLVLLVVGKQMPFTTRTGISAMHQIGGELEEAAEVAGSSWPRRFMDIVWPLSRTGFISGFLIVFVTIMRELSLFILLISPSNQVLTTLTFRYAELGVPQLSNALMSFLVLLIFIIIGIVKLYEKLTTKNKVLIKS